MESGATNINQIQPAVYSAEFELSMGDTWQIDIKFNYQGRDYAAHSKINAKT